MNIERPGAASVRAVCTTARRLLVLTAMWLRGAQPALAQLPVPSSGDSSAVRTPGAVASSVAVRAAADEAIPAAVRAPVADTNSARADEWPHGFLIHWNEYNLGFTTLLWGAAVLPDYASYNQDTESADHFDLERQGKIRDSRFMFFGRLHTKRAINWQTGLMYDWPTSKWKIRTTILAVAVPEISSVFQVGRIKEGLSLERVIGGYDGWTSERFTFSDAAIPLLADGVKWMGYSPAKRVLWNLGVYTDILSKGETFSYYRTQAVGRVAYVRTASLTEGTLLHVGIGLHVGQPEHDTLQLKSKPEVSAAPNFIDTGKFPATLGTIGGLEAYWRNGSWLYGGEYYVERATSAERSNPVFHGGHLLVTWIITGETREYIAPMGTFRAVSPKRPVWQGGPGAWEAVLRVSNIGLDADSVQGGKFLRVTPMVNWHMNDQVRLEFSYGVGFLDRFGVRSTTEFFQARLQLQFTKLGIGD